jgi:hypothetical protein
MDRSMLNTPEIGLFFENFDGMMRDFVRQSRAIERERFETLERVFGAVRGWAIEFDDAHPDRIESRGTMISSVENHMRVARDMLDVTRGEEESAALLDEPTTRGWILQNASTETGLVASRIFLKTYEKFVVAIPNAAKSLAADAAAAAARIESSK